MIPTSNRFDQSTLASMFECNALVQRYRRLFALMDWSLVPERTADRAWPGPCPHPESAYVKALLIKIVEKKPFITELRAFLVEHPLLVLDLGFNPVLDPTQPYGFVVEKTVPCDRWLRSKQQTLSHQLLQHLFQATVRSLQAEIPGLGETIAVDVKHEYAWVKENNPRVSIKYRFCKDNQPGAT
jgi:hypothetical protein